jgi:hypothetical protein
MRDGLSDHRQEILRRPEGQVNDTGKVSRRSGRVERYVSMQALLKGASI